MPLLKPPSLKTLMIAFLFFSIAGHSDFLKELIHHPGITQSWFLGTDFLGLTEYEVLQTHIPRHHQNCHLEHQSSFL